MAMQFLYEALDASGQNVIGKIAASSEEDANMQISQMGCTIIALHPARGQAKPTNAPFTPAATEDTAPANPPLFVQPFRPAAHDDLPTMAPPTMQVDQQRTMVLSTIADSPAPLSTTQDGELEEDPTQVGQGPAIVYRPLTTAAPDLRISNGQSGAVVAAGQSRIVMTGSAARQKVKSRPKGPIAAPGATAYVNDANAHLGSATNKDLMMFFRQLSSLVQSGMSIYAALENLAPRTPNRALKAAATEMRQAAQAGAPISGVMLKYPRVFPSHVAAMVTAGETGGFLEIALSELARIYEQNIALYKGSWIPKLLAIQAWYTLMMVLPLMPYFFSTFNLVNNVKAYAEAETFIWMPAAFAIHMAVWWMGRHLRLPKYRRMLDSLALKVPPFGDLQRHAALTNFLQVLRRLYHAGVTPIAAWECAMNTASNSIIRDKLAESYKIMQSGMSLPEAFQATGLFTSDIEQMITTGHHSGRLVEMLDHSTEFYMEQTQVYSGKAKFMMLRIGILATLILCGGALCWLAYSYFHGIFHYVDTNFSSFVLINGSGLSTINAKRRRGHETRTCRKDGHGRL